MSPQNSAHVKFCLINGEVIGESDFPADIAPTKENFLAFCKTSLQDYWVEGVLVADLHSSARIPDLVLVEDGAGAVICHWSKDDQLRDLIDRPFGWAFPLWSVTTQTLRQAIQLAASEGQKGKASGPAICQSHHIEVGEEQISRLWHRLSTQSGMPIAERLVGTYRSEVNGQEYQFRGRCQFEPYWCWDIALLASASETGPKDQKNGQTILATLSGSIASVGRGEAARNATHSLIEVAIDDWVRSHATA